MNTVYPRKSPRERRLALIAEKQNSSCMVDSVVGDFHQHLDECKQCRANPFELCAKGHMLLISSIPNAPHHPSGCSGAEPR